MEGVNIFSCKQKNLLFYWVATVDKWLSQCTKIILMPWSFGPDFYGVRWTNEIFSFMVGGLVERAFFYTHCECHYFGNLFFSLFNSFSDLFGFQVLESLRTCLTLRYLMSHYICRCHGHFIFYILKFLMQQKHVWEWAYFVQVIKFFF